MKREPVLIVMVLVAAVQILFHVMDWGTVDTDALEGALTVLVTLVGGVIARSRVTPVETIRQAGFSPAEISMRAANPAIPRYNGGE